MPCTNIQLPYDVEHNAFFYYKEDHLVRAAKFCNSCQFWVFTVIQDETDWNIWVIFWQDCRNIAQTIIQQLGKHREWTHSNFVGYLAIAWGILWVGLWKKAGYITHMEWSQPQFVVPRILWYYACAHQHNFTLCYTFCGGTPHQSRHTLGPTQPPVQGYRSSFPGVKRVERGVYHPLPSSA